jgi:exodeoxyribonuclease VII large subunit
LATPDTNEWVQRIKDLGYRLSHRLRSRLDAAWQHQDHLQKRLRHPQERLRHQHLQLQQLNRRLVRSGHRLIEIANARMELGYKRLSGARPATAHYGERLLHLRRRLHQYQQHQQTLRTRQLTNLITQLELLCPSLVLQRGYSIVRNVQGTVVKSPDLVRVGERLSVELSHGQLGVTVTDKSS